MVLDTTGNEHTSDIHPTLSGKTLNFGGHNNYNIIIRAHDHIMS